MENDRLLKEGKFLDEQAAFQLFVYNKFRVRSSVLNRRQQRQIKYVLFMRLTLPQHFDCLLCGRSILLVEDAGANNRENGRG